MGELFIGYNREEKFRILICASEQSEAQELADEYCSDAKLEGAFEVTIAEDINNLGRFDCDYIIIKN